MRVCRMLKMAIAFMLARGIGTPQILSSFQHETFQDGPPTTGRHGAIRSAVDANSAPGAPCADGWVCQHRWRQVYNMVLFHETTKGLPMTTWWGNGWNQIAFGRGDKGFVAFNAENFPMKILLKTNLPPGSYCNIISGDIMNGECHGTWHTVYENGTVLVEIGPYREGAKTANYDGVVAFLNTKSTMRDSSYNNGDSEEISGFNVLNQDYTIGKVTWDKDEFQRFLRALLSIQESIMSISNFIGMNPKH